MAQLCAENYPLYNLKLSKSYHEEFLTLAFADHHGLFVFDINPVGLPSSDYAN